MLSDKQTDYVVMSVVLFLHSRQSSYPKDPYGYDDDKATQNAHDGRMVSNGKKLLEATLKFIHASERF